MPTHFCKLFSFALIALLLSACGSDDDNEFNELPSFLVGDLSRIHYDGSADDLLTAGLGVTGLASATAPGYADPIRPTLAELRRNAIYANYRALQDSSSAGGFGRLYGPNVGPAGASASEGLVAGTEYISYATADNHFKVALMVQVPDSFDVANPCIVTAPSSGSRGIYGAIGTAGEWGLVRGCAVAYTDKGTGTGFHNLQADTSQGLRGGTVAASSANASFQADLNLALLEALNVQLPHRFAIKHAHSRQNVWKNWGQYVLWSIEFAFYVLNEQFSTPDAQNRVPVIIHPENTLVIASSISNGGGASIQAAEQDQSGWIDGVAVAEPNVQPAEGGDFGIQQGNAAIIDNTVHSKSLLDYSSLIALYQGCASLALANAGAPFSVPGPSNEAICASLQANNLLTATELEQQAIEAQQIINDYGVNPEQNLLQPSYFSFHIPQAITVLYANQHGRFGVEEHLCGFSYAASDATSGAVIPLPEAATASLFASSNGVPPTAGINLINNQAGNGPIDYRFALGNSGRLDQSLEQFLCLREQVGTSAMMAGIEETRVNGNLQGKPAVIVTGRNDAILPINHTSRPYYASNLLAEGAASKLQYYEIKNAQHLDSLNAFPGYDALLIPLHYYFLQALDLLYEHLKNGSALPPSQVVQTAPRGDVAIPLSIAAHLPAISATPAAENRIVFENQILRIPD